MALVHREGQDRWYFSKEELQRTPSVRAGIDPAKELSYRQQSANLIQDMGQRLLVSQLTINTAIVYMHRFYMFHSFTDMNRNAIASCCLFLSAKLEEQPRKLEHVIKVANICLQKNEQLDPKSEAYLQQAQDLVINESILLQTLGFELTVDHPHTHVVRITQLVRASKDLAQTSYFMATNSLHLTPFCIQHKPSVVACVCIHLACKWSNWEFPRSSDDKEWWEYVDPTVTKQTLDSICQEFLTIIENCPNRLKRRINTVTIYKGGHRPKTAGEKTSKNGAPTNGDAPSSTGESSKREQPYKPESSSNCALKGDHSIGRELSIVDYTVGRSDEQSTEDSKSCATLTITSSAAVVETPTSKVMLPPLQPLTTKYASMPGLASNSTNPESKSSSGNRESAKIASGTKHKHREHDESSNPAKKLKTMHSSSSHSSQSKHPSSSSRPTFQSKHSSHPKPSSHSTPTSHHSKLPMKSSSSTHTSQSHRSSSPKLPGKSSSSHSFHAHHVSTTPKLPVKSSSSHSNSSAQSHHSSSKRHNYPGHPTSNHTSSHSSGSKIPTSHKHSSPLDAKKSSGERHRRPSSSTKPKPEMTSAPSNSHSNDIDKAKKNVHIMEDFASPPGPQRLQKFHSQRPMNTTERSSSHHGPPLPLSVQNTPPPPPLPSSTPPPPPPPPT